MSQQSDNANGQKGLDWERILPIFMLVFVDVLGLTVILPLLHLYAAAFGASPLEIGIVAAAFPLAQLIGVPMMGALSDRFGRKPLLIISQVTTFASFILLGLANSLALVLLSRLLDGFFGANLATAQAAISDITDDSNRTQGLGLTAAAFGSGFVVGPLIAFASLEFTDSLAMPAFIAAAYSFLSILLTLFVFKETLPEDQRGNAENRTGITPFIVFKMLRRPGVGVLLVLMFAQQAVFYGFETLLGLFTLSRLGLLGQGNALIFLYVGVILIMVQARFIGKWSRKYGERKLVYAALLLLGTGVLLVGLTPNQPHIFYFRERVENDLIDQRQTSTEALVGDIAIELPNNEDRGFGGTIWIYVALIPVAIGSGMIRPSINSLLTKRVKREEYGSVLGTSSSFVSAANAISPIVGGLLFLHYGASAPFVFGGVALLILFLISLFAVRDLPLKASPI